MQGDTKLGETEQTDREAQRDEIEIAGCDWLLEEFDRLKASLTSFFGEGDPRLDEIASRLDECKAEVEAEKARLEKKADEL